ncbi:hypothetical protein [Alkalinema sp. FACHB-956]|uniref:hypothetical protein n=1 Tax=Alkalinema sp. FACHB-956 TaxID=2692768 RepID=UPI0016860F8F|nr:hypothetical protein [Alkalinema sp. FACHB-956]MBD2327342.1 hypothetical protein [Alkalinema sp. FACHB-956]
MIHNLNLDAFSRATESPTPPTAPDTAVSPEETLGTEFREGMATENSLTENGLTENGLTEGMAATESGALIPIDHSLNEEFDGIYQPSPTAESVRMTGEYNGQPDSTEQDYVDVPATEIPDPPQNRYDVHQDGSLTYFQYYFDETPPNSAGVDYAPQTFSTSKFPTGVVGAGVLAATVVSGFMIAEAVKQPTRPLNTTALKTDTQTQAKDASKTLTPTPSQPELLAPPKTLSVPLPPPMRTSVAPTASNFAALPNAMGMSGAGLAANPQGAIAANTPLRPISVAPPEIVMDAAAGGRSGTPMAQAPANAASGEGTTGNTALTPATPESLATIVSANPTGSSPTGTNSIGTNPIGNPNGLNNGSIAQNPNPIASNNPAISIETVPSLDNSANRSGMNLAPGSLPNRPSTNFPPTEVPTNRSSSTLEQSTLSQTSSANSGTDSGANSGLNSRDRGIPRSAMNEVSSQPPSTTMMPPTQEPQASATPNHSAISNRTQVLNALRNLQDFLVVPQKLASTDQIELLPLNTIAAQEAQSSQTAGMFSVRQLSQADYVTAWKVRNASDEGATEALGFPPHGFIDYKQQQIVLPKLVVADKAVISSAN